ncbi:peptidase M19 [Erythrobacter aquimaris]|uniref:Peptidase M19 n=1 Tax=Qipengyuania aquimaris TaxID=255984 RepID=A0A6I4TPG5_9SPHN|nr:dipeptidase [Qipengyuania aquimaris]MXO97001.1 peptidase M19 [Qipengyuania aquimaris]
MKRRIFFGFGAVVLLAVAGFFAFGPAIVERGMNKIDGKPLIAVSDEARALHDSLAIVDLHSDTLLWDRDLLDGSDRGHVDLPRLQQGNVALQVFSSVTKTPRGQNYDANGADTDNITPLVIAQLQPVRTWGSLLERSLYHVQKLDRAVEGSGNQLVSIRGRDDVTGLLGRRAVKNNGTGVLFSAEGLQSLEGDIANLDTLYAAGMRMAGLTHFFDNELAGSMHGLEKGGLTDMGRETVKRMEAMGMIVDIAHCSHQCVSEILAMATRPVVSSHGGVQATCEVNRNLTDEEIRGVAATGGIIGVGYWEGAVCDTSPRATAKAMKHIRDLVGIEHVALGSDYDGAVTVRFDTSELTQVTQALLDEGFSEEEIRAAMGGNALRVIGEGLVPQ